MKHGFKKVIALACAVLMLCSMMSVFSLSASAAVVGGGQAGTSGIKSYGCDLSFWNVGGSTLDYSLVDFAKMKSDGCEFAILRIGYEASATRANTLDTAFVEYYNRARAAGMKLGVYFYSLATTYAGAVDDAEWVISIIEKYDMYFEYPIYYDVEDSNQMALGSSAKTNLCLGWCETMANAGYFPGVYGTASLIDYLGSSLTDYYDIWFARVKTNGHGTQYVPENYDWSYYCGMWQYSWYDYEYYGIGLDMLDVNVTYKDYPTLIASGGYNNLATRHTVTFDSNGGTAVSAVHVIEGETLTLPANPTRYGFHFAGWYCDPELNDPYDTSMTVWYGFTLYAKWEEAYWDTNTNLMPNSSQMVLVDFEGTGESIWPNWNDDAYGSVTMYNGVTSGWSWPSAYMAYENSFDANYDSYIYVKKEGTAYFNASITYMDRDGELHTVMLSELAGIDTTDFGVGYMEILVNIGQYIADQGHMPDSGNVKFTEVRYFVIGDTDSYVKLYDMKLTPEIAVEDPYKSLYSSNVKQTGGTGSYTYDNGVLTMTSPSANGYEVTFTDEVTFDPSAMTNLVMDVNTTAPFNITMVLSTADGDKTVEFRKEFYNEFDLTTTPDALPSGEWIVDMNLLGYYEYGGIATDSSTVKSVTVSLEGEGTLTLKALQISRNTFAEYVEDGLTASGSLAETVKGDLDGDNTVTSADARVLLTGILEEALTDTQSAAADYNGDGVVNTNDVRAILLACSV